MQDSRPAAAPAPRPSGRAPDQLRPVILEPGVARHAEGSCLVRFGHVFSGLGLLVIAAGVLKWRVLPKWLGIWAAAMGVVGMAVTMGLPEYPAFYLPVFHAFPLWMACMGWTILRSGVARVSSVLEQGRAPIVARV